MIEAKNIYLSVGGFKIVCIIKQVEHAYAGSKFLEMLNNDYSEFISKKFDRPDLTLIVDTIDALHLEIKKPTADIEAYFLHVFSINKKRRKIYFNNPIGQFEFEYILGSVINRYLLPAKKGFSVHGSAAVYDNKAYLFEGKSGSGKSTTSQMLGGLCNILSDSNLIVKNVNGKFYAYETIAHDKNWDFKRSNKGQLIDRVFFVRKAKKCSVEEIKNKRFLLQKMTRQVATYDNSTINIQFPVIAEFVNNTDFYYLYVKKDEKVFKEFFKKEILKI